MNRLDEPSITSEDCRIALELVQARRWDELAKHPVSVKLRLLASRYLVGQEQWDGSSPETKGECIRQLCEQTILEDLKPSKEEDSTPAGQVYLFLKGYYLDGKKHLDIMHTLHVSSDETYYKRIRPAAFEAVSLAWRKRLQARVSEATEHQSRQQYSSALQDFRGVFEDIRDEVRLMRQGFQGVPSPRSTWTPRHFVPVVKTGRATGDEAIRLGDEVVVWFNPNPSQTWKDPSVRRVLGLWDGERSEMLPLTWPLKLICRNGATVHTTHRPLCIPSYDIDVEWRYETHVKGPLWGTVKEYAVSKFLEACQSMAMICRVVFMESAETNPEFHITSVDYNEYLTYEWPYYKGLEVAFTRHRFYRDPRLLGMYEKGLLRSIASELVATGELEEMVPERYRQMWHGRTLDAHSVSLVLQGVIERHRGRRDKEGSSQ